MASLESARIESKAIGEVALCVSMAPRLRSLALQVGYNKSNPTSATMHGMISLLKGCSLLEELSVRGHSSGCLHASLSNITTLHSLSLHLSSLTERSFMTVSTFPYLAHFDIHADRLSYDNLSAAISCTYDGLFFPTLQKLKIRAQPALVALILQQLPRDKLHSLHIDATGSGPFEDLFAAMATLPLLEFTLEHAISIDESDGIPAYTPDKLFALDHLRPLSKLPFRSFTLDTSLPPNLSDPAIEEMAKWWPRLERLQLGAPTALENVETNWTPRTSLASLSALARGCRHLESLVITLDVDTLPDLDLDLLGSHPLTSLLISSRSRPDVATLSATLSRLFPSLVDVTPGFVGEYQDTWDAVQASLSSYS